MVPSRATIRRNDEHVSECVILEADHFRESNVRQDLHVKDFLDG
jgi:hypothetical protein